MRLDLRALMLSAGWTAAATFTACGAYVALYPAGANATLGPLFHLDAPGTVPSIGWGGYLGGLLFWVVTASIVVGFAGWLYNHFSEANASSTAGFHFRRERQVRLTAPADAAFAYLDDHRRLGTHMTRSSWMMAGSRMSVELDESRGRGMGSIIRMRGRVLGLRLEVDSIVTERTPPYWKVWQTIGSPRLLVIGPYRMGFELIPEGEGCLLSVFIDYRRPDRLPGRVLGFLLGGLYAGWCVDRMVTDAARNIRDGRADRLAATRPDEAPAGAHATPAGTPLIWPRHPPPAGGFHSGGQWRN